MHVFGFERLEVWQESRRLLKKIYEITARFPDEERYGLTSQVRRSVLSVSSNIAEGSGCTTAKHQAHFSEIAYKSLLEALSQLIVAYDLGFLQEHTYTNLRSDIERIGNKINALKKYQLNKK